MPSTGGGRHHATDTDNEHPGTDQPGQVPAVKGGPATMNGEVAVDPTGAPQDVVAAALPVLDNARAAVTR
jgi:hypothetical protein